MMEENSATSDTFSRFSRVVENYVRYRPGYPAAVIDVLNAACGLTPATVVADIGSGTGLLTERFLANGNRVFAVEPNAEMRAAGAHHLRRFRALTSVDGTAEATTLAERSVDLVTAAQAFHWFKPEAARSEFMRILVPRGWVALVWNLEANDGSPLASALEKFWQTYIDTRGWYKRGSKTPAYVTDFFAGGLVRDHDLENAQVCDFEGLKGRVLSASRAPAPDDSRYRAMLEELEDIFTRHQSDGRVRIDYTTRIVYGQLPA